MLAYPRRVGTNGELSGQVALVTGGGRGIGAGIARQLADAGAKVAVAARTREQVDEVAREIDGLALELDVTDLAAVARYGETLNNELGGRVPVFFFSPGLVRTEMTSGAPADAPWTPPELAPRLVRVLASGRADDLAGRYIHAEHDDVEDLIRRADEIRERDLNAIRLQR